MKSLIFYKLTNRLVSVSTPHYSVVGFPVSIENFEKYERNVFIFNLCFVFDKNMDTTSYHQIVRKMARILRSLEVKTLHY